MRYAAKVDQNQSRIIAALEGAYCAVQALHRVGEGCPDLLVSRGGVNYLLEVKRDERARRRKGETANRQAEWRRSWRGPVAVVVSVEEALRAVGIIA